LVAESSQAQKILDLNLSSTEEFEQQLANLHSRIDAWCRSAAHCCGMAGDPQIQSLSANQWHDRLEQQLHAYASHRAAQLETLSQARARLADRQQRLKERKRQKTALLVRSGADNLADLQRQVAEHGRRTRLVEQRQRLSAEIDSALERSAHAQQIRQQLAAGTDVHAARSHAQDAAARCQIELDAAQQELAIARQTVHRQSSVRWSDVPAEAPPVGAADEASWNRLASELIGAILAERQASATAEYARTPQSAGEGRVAQVAEAANQLRANEPPLLRLATRFLRQIQGDDQLCIEWESASKPVLIRRADGSSSGSNSSSSSDGVPLDELSAPQQGQVIAALQLALVRGLARHLERLPVILGDSLLKPADATARRWARQLIRFARDQQLIVVTTDQAVAEMFYQLDIPLLVVTRKASAAQALKAATAPQRIVTPLDRRPVLDARRAATQRPADATDAVDPIEPAVTPVEYFSVAPARREDLGRLFAQLLDG
jgi:hypothetical protein